MRKVLDTPNFKSEAEEADWLASEEGQAQILAAFEEAAVNGTLGRGTLKNRDKRRATAADRDLDVMRGASELTDRSEHAVVGKEARVVEAVVVSKGARERVETIHDTVRRTEVEMEQLPSTRELSSSG